MSRSTPFFGNKAARPRRRQIVDEETYKKLHWTRQLELRPLREQVRREWPEGDSNTRLDQDWDPSITEEKE